MISTIVYGLLFLILLLIVAFSLFRLWFCRQPARAVPNGANCIVSPANGRVAVVQRFDTAKSETLKAKKWNRGSVEFLASDVAKKGWFVLIVMTPLNVHYQRAPFAGNVIETLYSKGKFRNAVKEAEKLLTLENERNEILLETKRGKLKIVQIAGLLARRIRCFVENGQRVRKGEEVGFIDLGSQVALVLPEKVTISVKPGERVVDGETIIGVWK